MLRLVKNTIKQIVFIPLFIFSSAALSETLTQSLAVALIDENGHAEIPDTYTNIDDYAFQNRTDLLTVTIPNTVTLINSYAFSGTSLRSVTIPDSVTNIGSYAFRFTPLNQVNFGNSLEIINRYAFDGTNLTSLAIPDSVTSIRQNAFLNLAITDLYLGESLVTIESGNFGISSSCTRLLSAEVKMQNIPDKLLEGCNNLNTLILENTIVIGAYAFRDTNIVSLEVPNTTLTIGAYAFHKSKIKDINLGNSVETIGSYAFYEANLDEIVLPETLININSRAFYRNNLSELVIPDNVVNIGERAFNQNNLISLTIGSSVAMIDHNAFGSSENQNCGPEIVVFKNRTPQGFSGCTQLHMVVFENGVEEIYSFENTSINGRITLPNTVTMIGNYAFKNTNITDIFIPNSVTTIQQHAFYSTNLKTIIIPPGVNDLRNSAFFGTDLAKVYTIEPADISFNYGAFDADDPIEFIFCANNDSDLDGVVDCLDAFPMDASESQDADLDGIGNNIDTDDDNDGYSDALDAFPNDANEWVDTDLDGIGNNSDNDDDNDGAVDSEDAFPLDENQIYDITGDILQVDSDNDGILDVFDPYHSSSNYYYDDCSEADTGGEANFNTDGDGKSNCHDPDDDNDGLLDIYEPFYGTNPLIPDSDYDGVLDGLDAFPMDNTESLDTDTDGIGNNTDTDDDNDGYTDFFDAFPLDATEWADSDLDGIGNNLDPDDDNDGVADAEDAFPHTASESLDSDNDGVGDNADAFPNDSTEVADTDLDGIGNNADPDDDNDGVNDADDGDPLNADIGIQPSQLISVAGNPVGVNGHSTRISLTYDTSDGDNQLPGIGFRVHYNSEMLTFFGTESAIGNDLIVNGDGPYQDDSDLDNNADTDKFILFGWASLNGNWPNVNLPASLVDVVFDVNWETPDQASINTPINFSKVDTTEGYNFEATNYALNVIPATWDFDGNGQADALTDGLILLRHAFGVRGATLTSDVMAQDATMTPEKVELAVEKAAIIADVDGNGEVNALTDALVVLRYMFGLRDEILVSDVIAADASRSSAEDISQHIELYMP